MLRKLHPILLLLPLLCVGAKLQLSAQQLLPNTWVPNGPVNSISRQGDIVYLGGEFNQVARPQSNGAVVNISTGTLNLNTTMPNGNVEHSIPDHNGGFFISSFNGGFTKVGNLNRAGLAHILADGSVSLAFNPALPIGFKKLIASTSDRVFVALQQQGSRSPLYRLYCLDFFGHTIWSRQVNGGRIQGGVIHNNDLYVVGDFLSVEGQPRTRSASFDVLSGDLLDWNTGNIIPPLYRSIANDMTTVSMGVSGGELFIRYRAFNDSESRLISVDLISGASTGFSLESPGSVPMLVHEGRIYLSSLQQGLIILDAATKQVLSNPTTFSINTTNVSIRSIAADDNSIYLCGAGSFVNQAGESIGDVISFDATTMELLPFNTSFLKNYIYGGPPYRLNTIAISNGNMFIGGYYSGINAVVRSNVYAYNVVTGELLPFSPEFDEYGFVLKVHATTMRLYISGIFYQVNGQDRGGLASFDLQTGTLNDWNPLVECGECLLVGNEETIFIGSTFNALSSVDGNPRNGLAAFDAITGQLLDWNPAGMEQITALAVGSSALYAVGVNASHTAYDIRSYDLSTGQELMTPVSVLGGSPVGLEVTDEHLFVSGDFTEMVDAQGQVSRYSLGSVNLSTGLIAPLSLNITPGQMVKTVSANQGTIYLGGTFNQVNGLNRYGLAAVNPSTGQVTDWTLNSGQSSLFLEVNTIVDFNDGVFIGGSDYGNVGSGYKNFAVSSPDRSNVVTGTVFYDNNQNGVQDAGEDGVPNLLMELQPGNIFYPTDANGNYTVYTGIGNYTLRPVHPTYAINVTPNERQLSFVGDLQTSANNNFAIAIIPSITDMGITLTTDQNLRPGFYFNYAVTFTNHGTVPSSGSAQLTYDSRLLYQSSSIAPASIVGNVLTYNFTDVEPGQSQVILVNMRVPVPTIEGSLMGEEVITSASVSTFSADQNNNNNEITLPQTVVGSVDPNDKLVTPQGHGPNGYVAVDTDHLEYTIRFQNVGTAPATFVTLEDVIDPNLNISTFTVVSASHAYTYQIVDRTLSVLFDNINLIDSLTDEPNSHGYFTFTIGLNDNLPVGTQIQNTASIIFDYNLPLETNTVTNTLRNPPYETTVFLPDSTGIRNTEMLMPVFVNDWNDVLGAQFSVAWDNAVATFVGVESFGLPGMDLSSFNLSNAADGYFSFAWSDPTITAQSLPDTTALFYIRFNLTGDFGSTTPVAITHYPVAIEVISEDYENMEVIRIDGVLNISSDITIQGTVRYSNNEEVQNVTIELSGASDLETATNAEGHYSLTFEPAEDEEGIVINPSKGSDPNLLNGIDVQDVASMRRHILRTESLTTAHQVIAADVSNNGVVSIQDVILLQALILGVETDFPSGRQWTFVDAAHVFTNALSPFPYPQTVEVDLVTLTAEDNFNFTAVKIGDVTMDRDNSQAGRTKGQEVVLEISAPEKKDDGTYEVSIITLGFVDVSAYQFTVVWDAAKLEFINVVNEGTQGVYGDHRVSEGLLTTVWDDDNGASLALADQTQLFKLRFNAIDENDLGLIEVTDQLTSMRMFDNQLNKIEFSVRQQANESKASGNFYPNPFEEMINISFTLKESQSVKIEILNDLGQKIGEVEDVYEKGWNEVKIDASNFKKGLYLFSINMGGKREVTKLIKK